jgi:uncharacterized protein YegP (UPF0339 family)
MAHRFEIYKDRTAKFRVRFKYNDEIIVSSQGYKSVNSAQEAIDSIRKYAANATIVDNSVD